MQIQEVCVTLSEQPRTERRSALISALLLEPMEHKIVMNRVCHSELHLASNTAYKLYRKTVYPCLNSSLTEPNDRVARRERECSALLCKVR